MDHLAHLVSLTIYIEVERRMMAQNDPLDEADDPRPKFFDRLIPINRFLDPLTFWTPSRRDHFTFLVSLTIYIELERRMIAQNDPLDKACHL